MIPTAVTNLKKATILDVDYRWRLRRTTKKTKQKQSLNFSRHIQTQVNKANSIMGLIRRTYTYLDERSFRYLFQALVRPHLEYAAAVWSPYKIRDIENIENVQRRATRLVPSLKSLDYPERLRRLKMPTLKYRRLRGDMIETYKITSGVYDREVTDGFLCLDANTRTRGNEEQWWPSG